MSCPTPWSSSFKFLHKLEAVSKSIQSYIHQHFCSCRESGLWWTINLWFKLPISWRAQSLDWPWKIYVVTPCKKPISQCKRIWISVKFKCHCGWWWNIVTLLSTMSITASLRPCCSTSVPSLLTLVGSDGPNSFTDDSESSKNRPSRNM